MTTPTKPRRPTDAEFETLAAAHDGAQGCRDMEAEARRARTKELALQTECDRLRGCETELEEARRQLEFERHRADLAINDREAAEAERDAASARALASAQVAQRDRDALAAVRADLRQIKSTPPAQEKRFPIQHERGAAAHPLSIPWALAEEAYSVYAARFGSSQSLERLAERGGFAPSEMDELRPGWREAASEIERLKAEHAVLRRERDQARHEWRCLLTDRDAALANIARLEAAATRPDTEEAAAEADLLATARGFAHDTPGAPPRAPSDARRLARAATRYANARRAATMRTAEAIKIPLAERDQCHGLTEAQHEACMAVGEDGVRYCPECRAQAALRAANGTTEGQ